MTWRITSRFGQQESFRQRPHSGIDFLLPKNTELRSIQDGFVEKISQANSNLGKGVFIKMEDGRTAIFGHLNKVTVKVGEKVNTGDLIGYSGNTGRVVGENGGYHLHFAIKENGQFLDPSPYIDHIQNMDKLNAFVKEVPTPELKLSISKIFQSNNEQLSDLLNMLKANFIYIGENLINNSIFVQHFKHLIEFFFW